MKENELHPIFTGEYSILTSEVRSAIEVVKKTIANRIPGIIIYGDPRIGKTKAITLIKEALLKEYGESLPIFIHLMTDHAHTLPVFFRELLLDLGCSNHDKGTGVDKKERAVGFLAEKGLTTSLKKVILFIDEANCLTEKEYNWLIDIDNRLKKVGVNITVILVGTPTIMDLRSNFVSSRKTQIIGRFMVKAYTFSGIKNIKDLQICLSWYDIGDGCEYPVTSGISYTNFFFPVAFKSGMRLSAEAGTLNKLLKKEYHINEIPMMYFCLIVESLYKQCGTFGKESEWITIEDWKTAIDDSGIYEGNQVFHVETKRS